MNLCFYNETYKEAVENYQITEDQLRFTGAPVDCTQLCAKDPDRHAIMAIEGGILVTYFNLHKNKGVEPYSDNPDAILLRAFSTDIRYIGNGYAKQALKRLPSFVRENFYGINEIVLAVNLGNEVAHNLYKKCGYVDEGERRMGKKGELIVMSYYL
ncbi:GNAT family N-acetyltransferase [Ureibacillus sinduriensis]|uniref:GNAT family acetyltransferase n=1 Tax=Ureibacillus sinduriensis BLB-1 = JCM 15800 TaxID=1384057 RepID=A0A0A3HWS8_9BACL|nr:GNAT family N-acetyltransferase [Ureibacillus sinduriensis]KGR77071.1 GNAT family acetyltransferase [Ureibacillus sinduriensis BLB-1 = JCM 15800]